MIKFIKRIWCYLYHNSLSWPYGDGTSICLKCQTEFYNAEFDNLNQPSFYEKRGLQ